MRDACLGAKNPVTPAIEEERSNAVVANEVADVGILFPSRDDGAILPRQSKSKTEKEETRAEKVATLAGIIYSLCLQENILEKLEKGCQR